MHEAAIEHGEAGRLPADDGWFILNLAEIGWQTVEGGGRWCGFESPSAPSPVLGIGVHVLEPGDAPGYYHAESGQEGFLAARYGKSVPEETASPSVAYAERPPISEVPSPWPQLLEG
jgi:hypothetical protein